MTVAYPPAEQKLNGGPGADGRGWGPFFESEQPWGIVMHTTETAGVPAYGGGVHPHLTYDAPRRRWVQHVRFDRRAGTLKGSSTVEDGKTVPTNAAKVLQVEIVCYSSRTIADRYGRLWVADLSDDHLRDLADFIGWAHHTFGVPLVWYPKKSTTSARPMSHREWWHDRAGAGWGVCEHASAADSSTHWDCGAINSARIMTFTGHPATNPPAGVEPAWPMLLRYGDRHPKVRNLRGALYSTGHLDSAFGGWVADRFTAAVDKAVRRFQKAAGITVDGIVGPQTRTALRSWTLVGLS